MSRVQRLRVAISPAEVGERLAAASGVRRVRKLPDLGDVVAGSPSYLIRADERGFELVSAGSNSGASASARSNALEPAELGGGTPLATPLKASNFDPRDAADATAELVPSEPSRAAVPHVRYEQGGGVLPSARLIGRILTVPEGALVEFRVEWDRSARSWSRWLGLCVTGSVASTWVVVGSGPFYQRLGYTLAFATFVAPVVVSDIFRLRRSKREELDLLALIQGTLGPLVVDTAHEPYRRLDVAHDASVGAPGGRAPSGSDGRSMSVSEEDDDASDDER